MTHKLSSPLTSIIGMASVLKGEIYGKLTEKQKEYIEIIYNSGQEMNFLVEEIINIGDMYNSKHIQAVSVDLQLIAQQVIKNLEYLADKKEQTLCLSMTPGNPICVLDKQKIKQTIYYIIIAIIEGSQSGGEIQIHISSRNKTINLSFWVTHSWLGEGISFENIKIYSQIVDQFSAGFSNHNLAKILESLGIQDNNESKNNNFLWLLFAIYLVKLQKGSITFKGSSESGGHRFVINIPLLNE
jgi:K+-sensing histidine kinase KdpD